MSSTAETIGSFATKSSRRAPSTLWYWLAGVIILLGVGAGVTWGVVSTVRTHDRAEGLPRTQAPGTVEVTIVDEASSLIYFEGDGKPSPEELGLSVTGPDGSPVQVQPYEALMQYEIAGWVGTPVASFSTPVPGTYAVSADKAYHQGRISAGDNFVRSQAIDIVGALALIVTSIVAGVVIAVVVLTKRSAARTPAASQATAT